MDVAGCAGGDMASCAAAAIPGVPGGGKHAIPAAAPERIGANTNSLGETVISIQGKEMSIHASKQATYRGISNEDITAAMDQKSFSYVQNGETLQGYYDPATNLFVGVGDRITTVKNPKNPKNHLENLRARKETDKPEGKKVDDED